MATFGLDSPVPASPVTKSLNLDDIFDMSAEEVRLELEKLKQDTRGMSKSQMQKLLAKLVAREKEEFQFGFGHLEIGSREGTEKTDFRTLENDREFQLAKLKMEERRLQAEERKAEIQAEERKLQTEERKAEIQAEERRLQTEERKAEMQEKLKMEERERVRKAELEKMQAELQEKEKQRQYELELKRIEAKVLNPSPEQDKDVFRVASAVKLVPKFDEANIEHYFISFEKAMTIHKFPRDKWTALLHPQLTGKAQQVFSELSLEGCQDYDTLKQALLTAFARVPEFYRKRFRTLLKGTQETFSVFAFRLALPFHRWLEGEGALDDLPKVLEVFKLEQFVNCLPVEIHRWIIDKKPSTLAQAAKLADEFAVLYMPIPAHVSVLRPNEGKRVNSGFGRDSSRGQKRRGKRAKVRLTGHSTNRC